MATLYNKQNVAIGVANLYVADIGTLLPADSISFGTAWGGAWTYQGASVEGLKFSIEPDVKEHRIEESATPALITVDTTKIMVETELAEDTMETLKLAYGGAGTITATAAGSGTIGKKELVLVDALKALAVGYEVATRAGFWRRFLVPQMNSIGKAETSYRRSESLRTYPVEFSAICDTSDVVIREMVAAAL